MTAIPYPSGNPLLLLDPQPRALVLLLCTMLEPVNLAGRLILGPPARDAHLRALRVLRDAQRTLHPAPLPTALPNPRHLRGLLPDPIIRAAFVLKASGLFEPQDLIADLLHIHRATFYRHLTRAIETLSAYLSHQRS